MPPSARLFIVPALAAGMRAGSARARARSRTSTIRCEVSTFPPATAAGKRAWTTEPSGARMRSGHASPSFGGMGVGASAVKT